MDVSVLGPQNLSEALRASLQRAGVTAEGAAKDLELGVTTMHNYVRGERVPNGWELRHICRYLAERIDGLTVDELWGLFGALLDNTDPPASSMMVRAKARTRTHRR